MSAGPLAKSGLKVVCIEAQNYLWGTSQDVSWMQTYGGIPSLYGTWGALSDPYDHEVVYHHWQEQCFYSAEPELLYATIDAAPEGWEWWIQQGLEADDPFKSAGFPDVNTGCLALKGTVEYTEIGIPGYARCC